MIIPIRCFTCGAVMAHLWKPYQKLVRDCNCLEQDALNKLKVRRMCCRRMLLTHIELIDQVIRENAIEQNNDSNIVQQLRNEMDVKHMKNDENDD